MQAGAHNFLMHTRTREIIKELVASHRTSLRQVALAVGLEPSTLTRFMANKVQDLGFSHIQKIADHFFVTVDQLTGRAPLGESRAKELKVLQAMEKMESADKDILVETSSAIIKRYTYKSETPLNTNHDEHKKYK